MSTGGSETLLRASAVSKTFAGARALDAVDLTVDPGEIVAIVGQNGSGKSTLVKILAGVHEMEAGGEIRVRDAGRGQLHFIHQDLGLIPQLTTIENLDLGRALGRRGLLPFRRDWERRHARELIARFGADFDVELPVGELTPAEQAIVAIARALDGWADPHGVLVLDEPTAALQGDEVDRLFGAVRRVAERGGGVIFISHRLDEVIDLADRVVALRDGRVVGNVPRGELRPGQLLRLIAGSDVSRARRARRSVGEPVLTVSGLSGGRVQGLDLEVRAGEVVGLCGVLGSGREELGSLVFGAMPPVTGEVAVAGATAGSLTPRQAIAAGVGFVPADRHRQGMVMSLSARENVTLPRLGPVCRAFGRIDGRSERAEVLDWMLACEVRPPEPDQLVAAFSGGNQQKLVLAKWLRTAPKLLLLEEPTQGVDVGAKAAIHALIARASEDGTGVVVSSSDTQELADICDRTLVLRDGLAVAELSGASLTDENLTREALGLAAEAA